MEFVSDDSIRITARGTTNRYTFAELGFKDGRKGICRTRFGESCVRLPRRTEPPIGAPNFPHLRKARLKASIKQIRHRLKKLMGIDDDPFRPYRQMEPICRSLV